MLAGTPDVRPAAGPYERRLDKALRYYRHKKDSGWTSEQVDNERAWLLDAYDIIDDALAEAQERRRQMEGGSGGSPHGGR